MVKSKILPNIYQRLRVGNIHDSIMRCMNCSDIFSVPRHKFTLDLCLSWELKHLIDVKHAFLLLKLHFWCILVDSF